MAADRFADHFSALAANYAQFRPHYPRELPAALAAACARRELAWDSGAGSGQLSTALASHFRLVIATEPAQKQLADATPHAGVEYRCETAEHSSLADGSVDLAVAAQAAHWYDWPRYVDEVTRVTRAGAVAAIVGYGNPEVAGPAAAPLARYMADVADDWPPGRAHILNGYRDLTWPHAWTRVVLPAIAMTAAWTRVELHGYIATWSATARHRAAHGAGRLEAFADELAHAVPDPSQRLAVRWPLIASLARR